MTTWTAVTKIAGSTFTNLTNLLCIQSFGHFSLEPSYTDSDGLEETSEYTDAEHLTGIQSFGHLQAYVSGIDSSWNSVDKQTSTWVPVTQSNTIAAWWDLPEAFEGIIWTAVTKDE